MCLVSNRPLTKKFNALNDLDLTFVVYKVLRPVFSYKYYTATTRITGISLNSPHQRHQWLPGEQPRVSAARPTYGNTSVYSGYHVALTEAEAKRLQEETANTVIVPVQARLKDLAAAGKGSWAPDGKRLPNAQAVFDTVTLLPEVHDRIIEEQMALAKIRYAQYFPRVRKNNGKVKKS